MKPGDVVVGVLVGAHEAKVRPAVVIASAAYLRDAPFNAAGTLAAGEATGARRERAVDFYRVDI